MSTLGDLPLPLCKLSSTCGDPLTPHLGIKYVPLRMDDWSYFTKEGWPGNQYDAICAPLVKYHLHTCWLQPQNQLPCLSHIRFCASFPVKAHFSLAVWSHHWSCRGGSSWCSSLLCWMPRLTSSLWGLHPALSQGLRPRGTACDTRRTTSSSRLRYESAVSQLTYWWLYDKRPMNVPHSKNI